MPISKGNTESVRHGERAGSDQYWTEETPGDMSRTRLPAGPTLLLQNRNARTKT